MYIEYSKTSAMDCRGLSIFDTNSIKFAEVSSVNSQLGLSSYTDTLGFNIKFKYKKQ